MKTIKNLTQSLVTIPLISLSVIGLNFATAVVATPVIPKPNAANTTLMAQRLSCNVVNIQSS